MTTQTVEGPPYTSFMVMYGSHTFKHTSSKVTTHVLTPTDKDNMTLNRYLGKEMTQVRGTNAVAPACTVDPNGVHGKWYRCSYEHKEGQIIGFKLYSTINGGVRAHSMLLLQLRADGPYITAFANLTPAAQATYQRLPVFTGRADVLTPKEAKEAGLRIPISMERNFMDQQEVSEDFSITVTDKGSPRPTYELLPSGEGGIKVAVVSRPKRRLRIRR